nr:ATP-binding protein [Streptomyces sp. TverLS-915]
MLGREQNQSLSPVFVGRDAESGVLAAALGEVSTPAADGPRAGARGGGGGRQDAARRGVRARGAARGGARRGRGLCRVGGGDGLPFAPFATALRTLRTLRTLRAARPEEFARAGAGMGADLARLLPETAGPHAGTADAPGPSGVPHSAEDSARLFGHVTRLLEELSAARPLVLVLEDLHWADASTRHLYAHLLRTVRAGRLLLLATYRSDDLHRRHPCGPCSPSWTGCAPCAVSTSRASATPTYAASSPGYSAPSPKRPSSTRYTRAPRATPSSSRNWPSRCARGTARGPARTCANCSSSASRPCRRTPGGCCASSPRAAPPSSTRCSPPSAGCPRRRCSTRCAPPRAAHLLSPTPEGDGYRFRHSLVREAVGEDLLPGERSALNRRYAETVEAAPHLVRAEERDARLAGYW